MNHDLNVLLVRMEKVRGLGFISLVIKNREMTKTPFDFWFSRKDLQDWLLHACSAHNNEAFYYTNFESRLAVRLENRSGEDDNNIAVFELFIYKTFTDNYVMYSFRIDAPTLLKFLESPDTPLRFLYHPDATFPRIICPNVKSEVLSSPLKRRALSKALRDSFKWKGSKSVTLYRDWGDDFYFVEEGGISGGLCLSDYGKVVGKDGVERNYYRYSVHT